MPYHKLCTGLKDKLKQDLFEGDVVEFPYKNFNNNASKQEKVRCLIVWNPTGMWSLKWKDGYINGAVLNPEKYTRIGSIHEQPSIWQ